MKQNKILLFLTLFLPIIVISNNLGKERIYKDSLLLKKMKSEFFSLKKKGSTKEAIIYADSIIKLLKREKEGKELALAYNRIGYLYYRRKEYNRAYKNYKKAKKIYQKLNDSLNVASRLLALSKIECKNEFFLKSDSSAINALKYTNNREEFKKIKASIYNNLGVNSINQGQFNEAINYYNLAIETINDSVRKTRYLANKAVVFKHQSQYKKAIKIYDRLINNNFFNQIDLKLKLKILDNFTYTKFLEGEVIDENDFLKTQKLKDSIGDYGGVITNYSYLSDYYLKNNPQKALFYAKKMYDLSKEKRNPNDRIEAIDKLIKVVNGKVLRKYALERSFLKDSIIDARKKSRSKLVKVIYNFDLLEEQKLKAEIKSEQQKSQKQLWLFIGLTSLLSFITYFFYKRNKTKKEKVIEVYKTETRLAKKIHDELANDVYLVMNKIQQGEDEEVLLNKLEKIYSQTRNISHENSPVLTGIQFEYFLKQLFTEFNSDTCKVLNKGLSTIDINKLTKEKQIVVYRVLQELLVNMKKYSNASLVMITFKQEKDKLHIKYKDNGVGVDKLKIKNGLQNMETRIRSVGGTIIFESENQKGFQAKFQLKK